MIYGAASWALTQREEQLLESCDRRMMRRMCGLSLRDRVASVEILRRIGLEDILVVVRKRRMAWFGHVYRREDDDPLSTVKLVEAPGRRPRGRPKKAWMECVKGDLQAADVSETVAGDRAEWIAAINRLTPS